MRTVIIYILLLCSIGSAVEVATATEQKPSYPMFLYFNSDGYVYLVIHMTPYYKGDWDNVWFDYQCKLFAFNQRSFLEFLAMNWLRPGLRLNAFNALSKNWLAMPTTYNHMGLTQSEYLRWVKTGELIKDADYAARLAEEEAKRKAEEAARLAETYTEFANLKYYINLADGFYHQAADCPDCIDDVEISVMSIFEMGMTRKQCQKCFGESK